MWFESAGVARSAFSYAICRNEPAAAWTTPQVLGCILPSLQGFAMTCRITHCALIRCTCCRCNDVQCYLPSHPLLSPHRNVNYNVKPREISAALDGLGDILVQVRGRENRGPAGGGGQSTQSTCGLVVAGLHHWQTWHRLCRPHWPLVHI